MPCFCSSCHPFLMIKLLPCQMLTNVVTNKWLSETIVVFIVNLHHRAKISHYNNYFCFLLRGKCVMFACQGEQCLHHLACVLTTIVFSFSPFCPFSHQVSSTPQSRDVSGWYHMVWDEVDPPLGKALPHSRKRIWLLTHRGEQNYKFKRGSFWLYMLTVMMPKF